jgi:hypothetical protein
MLASAAPDSGVAASRPVPDAAGAVEVGSGYFTTAAHYLSVAGRIAGALRDGSLVLVAGDPPGDPHFLAEALHVVAQPHRTVIRVPWDPELRTDVLAQASVAVASPSAGGGTEEPPKTPGEIPPLFVFGEAERLSERQLEEICEAVQRRARKGAAGVLLARSSFLARLEDPSLSFVKAALASQFRFDELGEDESIDFLRHQISTRQMPDRTRGISAGFVRALAAFVVLATIPIGALLAVHYFPFAGPPATGSARQAQTPPAAPNQTATKSAPQPAGPAALPWSPQAAPGAAAPSQSGQMLPPIASPPARTLSPADRGFSPAEVTTLLTRGDQFLRTGDIASARLFYERAAEAGIGAAALRLGATFDPRFLSRAGVVGVQGDPAQAAGWYRRARDLGEAAAGERLNLLEQPPVEQPPAADPHSSAR